jgi:hypothetical protein
MLIYQCECCGHESNRIKDQGPDGMILCNKCADMRWCKDCESWVKRTNILILRKHALAVLK